MGKYTKLRGVLPAFQEESSYQDKVNDEKKLLLAHAENMEDANINRFASLYGAGKAAKDALEEQISAINIRLEALSQLLVEAMENQGADKIQLSTGATVYIQDTPYPQVKDREALMAWINKNKMALLLSVNYQTLKGMTNDMLVAGKKPPEGVEVFLKTQARLRNGASSEG